MFYQPIARYIFILFVCFFASYLPAQEPATHLVIIGGGHLGLVEAYLAREEAKNAGHDLQITIYEQNPLPTDTTAANIWNSHTPDELLSVVPRGKELAKKLQIPFNAPGGIRVTDVRNVNDSPQTKAFIERVERDSQDEAAYERRTRILLKVGRAGMMLWKKLYENAAPDLQELMKAANFNPCFEIQENQNKELHKGYRIDLVFQKPDAKNYAANMVKSYQDLGYAHCKLLTPDEVIDRDPHLRDFCLSNSTLSGGVRTWKPNATALWRPGGCIDTQTFIPQFAAYLQKDQSAPARVQIAYGKKVVGVRYGKKKGQIDVLGLIFEDGTSTHDTSPTQYVFCPGEAVGTLRGLGFAEPAYAGFAGASLSLNVPVTPDRLKQLDGFSHCMEVHKEGIVLAWQARVRGDKIFVGTAGTKAYYGDQKPHVSEAFAKDRNLLQLNAMNEVLPQIVSWALGRDTKGQTLTHADMVALEKAGIAKRWVGRRAVAYDGFPTLGALYHQGILVQNASTTTHLGSGGGSFAFVSALLSAASQGNQGALAQLQEVGLDGSMVEEALSLAHTNRSS